MNNRRHPFRVFIGIFVTITATLGGTFFLLLPRILADYPKAAEDYARFVFPQITKIPVLISSSVPVSLTEIFLVSSLVWGVLLLIVFFISFARSPRKARFLRRFVCILACLYFLISASYTLQHGLLYDRYPLQESLGLETRQRTPEELSEVSSWLAGQIAELRTELPEDQNGCAKLTTSVEQTLSDGNTALDSASTQFPVLAGNMTRGKPVILSHLWSYTGITGMYFPFFAEANVNVDVPMYTMPFTICHELAHTRGIAREQDANLAAFLSCISSDRADFRYSGYQYAYLYCANDLYYADPAQLASIASELPSGAFRDWQSSTQYWKQFEGPVQEASTKVNDSFLKANQQDQGVRSYSMVTDLIIDYYFTYVKGA